MLRELQVHHSGKDGLLFVLEDQKGFGKLTPERCGGDELAQRILTGLVRRSAKVPVTPSFRRDSFGFLPLHIDVTHVNPTVLSMPAPIQAIIATQYRKQILCPLLGRVVSGRVVKVTPKGTLLAVNSPSGGQPLTAITPFEGPSLIDEVNAGKHKHASKADVDDVDAHRDRLINIRLLDYDVSSNTFSATLKPDVVKRGAWEEGSSAEGVAQALAHAAEVGLIPRPLAEEALTLAQEGGEEEDDESASLIATSASSAYLAAKGFSSTFQHFTAGMRVNCRVCLSSSDQGAPVVEVTLAGDTPATSHSVIGFVHLLPNDTERRKQMEASTGTKVGLTSLYPISSAFSGIVEYAPSNMIVSRLTPFLVVTREETSEVSISESRVTAMCVPTSQCAEGTTGLVGSFPWRSDAGSKRDRDEGDAADSTVRRRRVEEAIDEYERQSANVIPTSPIEFKKLLLSTPNNSFLWTQYIAFHVNLHQIEEARMVAEKAIKTINFRESKELMNIWVAYMNLENLHGTSESLTAVFKRALQHTDDPFIIHTKLADIFKSAKKTDQEIALCRAMTGKFRVRRDVWERLGVALIDCDRRDQMKKVVKDVTSGTSPLHRNDQILVVEHLAIHEYRRGSVESGRALFEGLVAKAPKKADLWQAYIDQEIVLLNRKDTKSSVSGTRQILERLTTVQFSPKVMQQFLTRFLSFEQTYGTPANVEKVKAKARQYVESRLSAAGEANASP